MSEYLTFMEVSAQVNERINTRGKSIPLSPLPWESLQDKQLCVLHVPLLMTTFLCLINVKKKIGGWGNVYSCYKASNNQFVSQMCRCSTTLNGTINGWHVQHSIIHLHSNHCIMVRVVVDLKPVSGTLGDELIFSDPFFF